MKKILFYIFIFVSVWGAVALVYVEGVAQVLFGVWVIIPLLFTASLDWETVEKFVSGRFPQILLWCTISGIFINNFVSFPWEGLDVEVLGVTKEVSREWYTGGFKRLAGFSDASFNASTLVLVLLYLCFIRSTGRFMLFIYSLLGMTAILMTTSKTAIVSVLVVLMYMLTYKLQRVWKALVLFVLSLVYLLPFYFSQVISFDKLKNPIEIVLFASFLERITTVWPYTIALVRNHGSLLFGRGIGGVGVAQSNFEHYLYTPGDNLAVYVFALSGLIGVSLTFLFLLYRIVVSKYKGLGILLVILLLGLTINCIESAILSLFAMVAYRYSINCDDDC